jgi:hypothetical protein
LISSSNHIVNKCKWITSFDSKEKSHELQNSISNWSSFQLNKEINDVLDQFSAGNSNLRIEHLEIDLGIIDYEDLTQELSKRVKLKIEEKLSNLILDSSESNASFEHIYDEESGIEVIRFYLLNGVFPWHATIKADINELVEEQFKGQKSNILNLISVIGGKEHIRRRIAYQFKEKNIIQLIKGLEPGNHEFILDFSNDLIKSQQRDKHVTQNLTRFKSDVWYWILTHLIVERGSVFNNTSFIKSAISQMANSYQVEYALVLNLIKTSIANVSHTRGSKPAFIQILEKLSNEIGLVSSNPFSEKEVVNNNLLLDWTCSEKANDTFENYLRSAKGNQLKLVELEGFELFFLNLSEKNKIELIKRHKNNSAALMIHLLQKMPKSSREKIWIAVFQLLKNDTQLYQKEIAEKIHADLLFNSNSTFLLVDQVVRLFSDLKVESLQDASICLKFIRELSNVIQKKDQQSFERFLERRIVKYLKSNSSNSSESIRRLLEIWINVDVNNVLKFLTKHSDSTIINDEIIRTLSFNNTHLLLKNSDKELYKLFKEILNVAESIGGGFEVFIAKNLPYIFLNASIISRGNITAILENLFLEIEFSRASFNQESAATFENLLTNYFEEKSIKVPNSLLAMQGRNESTIDLLFSWIEVGKSKQVAQLLITICNNKSAYTKLELADKQKVYEYFLPNANRKFAYQVSKYSGILKEHTEIPFEKKSSPSIEILIFQCLSSFHQYSGDEARFNSLLKRVFEFQYPGIAKDDQQVSIASKENGQLEALSSCLIEGLNQAKVNNRKISFKDLMFQNLELSPSNVRVVLQRIKLTDSCLKLLIDNVNYPDFVALIFADNKGKESVIANEIVFLTQFIHQIVGGNFLQKLQEVFWKKTISSLQRKSFDNSLLQELAMYSFKNISDDHPHINSHFIREKVLIESIKIPFNLGKALATININVDVNSDKKLDESKRDLNELIILKVYESVLTGGVIPQWFISGRSSAGLKDLNELIAAKPLDFISAYRLQKPTLSTLINIVSCLDLKMLSNTLSKVYPSRGRVLGDIEKIRLILSSSAELSHLIDVNRFIGIMLLKVWSEGKWDQLNPDIFWKKWISEIFSDGNNDFESIFDVIKKLVSLLPPAYRISFKNFLDNGKKKTPLMHLKSDAIEADRRNHYEADITKKALESGLLIPNAGLVILNGFFKMLFDRLGLLDGDSFINESKQIEAIHYLQHVAIGSGKSEEADMALNKILVGLPLAHPIPSGHDVKDEEVDIIQGMLEAAIGHWSAIGKSSIHGFRGNWFVRSGLLYEKEEYWNLVVEKRAYDILLNQSPFSFSIIKLPWMPKPLKVEWPY